MLAPTVEALEDMFMAALSIGNPGLPMAPEVRHRVEPTANAIEPLLDPATALRLRAAFLKFVDHGGTTNLRRWIVTNDRTASRAGFVLCEDLGAAHAMLELEDRDRREARMDDLLFYAISERYSGLRKAIGIALQA